MAARKKAAKASKATKSKPISKPSSVSKKNTSAKISKPPTRQSNRILMKSKRHEVRRLENGLVDMSETPPWLVDIAERNAKQSPFLRLPGEIRNKIYRYAMTGNVAMVIKGEDRAEDWMELWFIEEFYIIRAVGVEDGHCLYEWLAAACRGESTLNSASHLHEVCRQIYTETSTMVYSGTIFYFEEAVAVGRGFTRWSSTLRPAQRNAVTDIAIQEISFPRCGQDIGHASFRSSFPGLKRLHICRHDADFSRLLYMIGRGNIVDNSDMAKKFEDWIQRMVRQIENADIKVIFHPKQPAGDS